MTQALSAGLKPHGFKVGKSEIYSRDQEGGVAIVSVYKSNFDCAFYVDLGIASPPTVPGGIDVGGWLDVLLPESIEYQGALRFSRDRETLVSDEQVELQIKTIAEQREFSASSVTKGVAESVARILSLRQNDGGWFCNHIRCS